VYRTREINRKGHRKENKPEEGEEKGARSIEEMWFQGHVHAYDKRLQRGWKWPTRGPQGSLKRSKEGHRSLWPSEFRAENEGGKISKKREKGRICPKQKSWGGQRGEEGRKEGR